MRVGYAYILLQATDDVESPNQRGLCVLGEEDDQEQDVDVDLVVANQQHFNDLCTAVVKNFDNYKEKALAGEHDCPMYDDDSCEVWQGITLENFKKMAKTAKSTTRNGMFVVC